MTWLLVVIVSGYVAFVPYQTQTACERAVDAIAARSATATAFCIPHD